MIDDRPPKKETVTVDQDAMDDECTDYLVVVPINSVWFHKLKNGELLGVPPAAQVEIVKTLGEHTLKAILGLNEQSYDEIDIAKAYHLLTENGFTVTDNKDGE